MAWRSPFSNSKTAAKTSAKASAKTSPTSKISTYKFSEAVEYEVFLDLVDEARDIDQKLGSQDKVDAWFDAKTQGLNDWQKATLREQWGTKQKVLSSRSRMDRVVSDIIFDFSVKPRLNNDRGNAMLIASSIYEACKYYELFQKTAFKGKCAIITSYNPQTKDITTPPNSIPATPPTATPKFCSKTASPKAAIV